MPYVEADGIQCLYGCICCNVYHAYVLVSPKNELPKELNSYTPKTANLAAFQNWTLDPKCRRGAPEAGRSYYNKYKYRFIKKVIIIFQVFYRF